MASAPISFLTWIGWIGKAYAQQATPPLQAVAKGLPAAGKERKAFPKRPAKGTRVEIPEWRSAKARHFLNDDGTFTAEVSADSQFYEDRVTRQWKSVDNALVASNRKGYAFTNKANRFKAEFAPSAGNGATVRFEIGKASLEFNPVGTQGSVGRTSANKISYPEAFPNADLNYMVDADDLKEQIVLKKPDALTSYSYLMSLNNLKYVEKGGGLIEFQYADTGEFAFLLQPPVMFESGPKPQASNKVTQVIRTEGEQVFLDVVADREWINAPGRKFPVIIDPSIETERNYFLDTFASKKNPGQNYHLAEHMYAGTTSEYGESEAFAIFPLPGLAEGAYVTRARMLLYNYLPKTAATPVSVYPVTQGWWPESSVTWNTRPPRETTATTTTSVSTTGWQTFEVGPLVQSWYTHKRENFGVALAAAPGTAEGVGFATSNHTSTGYGPKISIDYTIDPDGVGHYWTHTADGVMPFKGNLHLASTDLVTKSLGYDTLINRNYNSRQRTKPGVFGPGWLSLLDMKVYQLYGSVGFLDDMGTRHIFDRLEERDAYVPPPGVPLSLVRTNEEWRITTPENLVYVFSRADNSLKQIVDRNGQALTFSKDVNGDTLITDPSHRVTRVHYEGGLVASATDPKGRTAEYTYVNGLLDTVKISLGGQSVTHRYTYAPSTCTTAGCSDNRSLLSSVIEPNGATTSYAYDDYDRIKSVTRTIDGQPSVHSYSYVTETTTAPRKVTVTGTGEPVSGSGGESNASQTVYSSNAVGNITQTDVTIRATEVATSTFTWGPNHWLQSYKDPNGNVTKIQYGNDGKPIQVTTPEGKEINLNYDTNANLISFKDPTNGVTGTNVENNRIVDITDNVGNTVMRNFDAKGNLQFLTEAMSLSENFALNSGFESTGDNGKLPRGWNALRTMTAGEMFDTDAVTKAGGYQSLHVKSLSTTAGMYGNQTELIAVLPNYVYNVSAEMKLGSSSQAEIRVAFYDKAGALLKNETGLSLSKSGTGGTAWHRKSTSVTAPANAAKARLTVGVIGAGEAWFDNMMFEGGTGRAGNNLLTNFGFEHDIDKTTLADGWYKPYTTTTGISIDYSDQQQGIASERIVGNPGNYQYAIQRIEGGGLKGTRFSLSGWSKQAGVPTTGGTWALQLELFNTDGTMEYLSVPFERGNTQWQQASRVLEAPKDFYKMGVKLAFDQMPSTATAWFDDVKLSLVNTVGSTVSRYNYADNSSFEYDKDGTGWPDGWYRYTGNPSGTFKSTWVNLTTGGGNVYTGTRAVRITDPDDWESVARTGERIPFDTSKTYTAVGYIKTFGVTSSAVVIIHAYDAAGNHLAEIQSNPVTGTKDWTRVMVNLNATTVPAGTAKLAIGCTMRAGKGTAYFDNIRMQEGEFRTRFEYDANGAYMTKVTDPTGSTVSMTPDPASGLYTSMTNARNYRSLYEYDMMGQLTKMTFPYQGAYGRTPTDKTFGYTYDVNGNLTKITAPDGTAWSTFEFNEIDQIKKYVETVTVNGTPYANPYLYQYDAAGRMTKATLPDGKYNQKLYDSAGRVKELRFGQGTTQSSAFLYSYDKGSNVISHGTATEKYTFEYDSMNRLKKQIESDTANTVTYTYDAAGRRNRVDEKFGPYAWAYEYTYDSAGYPKSMRDLAGTDVATHYWLYDEAGRRHKQYNDNRTNTFFEYDTAGRTTQVRTEYEGTVLSKDRYEYDENGNEKKVWRDAEGTWTEYTYDSTDQLLLEKNSNGNSKEYQYDELGNRTVMMTAGEKNGTTTYGYNTERNRLLTVQDPEAGLRSYSYDANGNVLSDGKLTYKWGNDNRLQEVKTPAKTINYSYDALGRREIKQVVGGLRTRYHYDGDRISYVTEWDGTNTNIYRFAYDHKGMPVFMRYDNKRYWYHYDRHGNVIRLTDEAGATVVRYTYDAYGNTQIAYRMANSVIPDMNPFTYSHYWYDGDTGKFYLNARYYDPEIGRFLSKDPISVTVGTPHALNAYHYAGNNPVNYVDRDGSYIEFDDEPGPSREELEWTNQVRKEGEARRERQRAVNAAKAGAISGGTTLGAYPFDKKMSSVKTERVTTQIGNMIFTKQSKAARVVKGLGKFGVVGFAAGMVADYGFYKLGYTDNYSFLQSLGDNFVMAAIGFGVGAVLGVLGAPVWLTVGVAIAASYAFSYANIRSGFSFMGG